MDGIEIGTPEFADLAEDLKTLRRSGIVTLRDLQLDALATACRATGRVEDGHQVRPSMIERLIRDAVDEIGDSQLGRTAAIALGLQPDSRGTSPAELRREAAEEWQVSQSRYRQRWEPYILGQVAETILLMAETYRMRLAQLEMARRTPASTRLAIEWLGRFEAMYAIWTPTYALGADLTAYRATLLEREPAQGSDVPDWQLDPGADQEVQAAGYVTSALFHHTHVLVAVEAFQRRFGGLWLLSDLDAEQEIADAVYRISWHTPNNQRDDSHLRVAFTNAGGEIDPFLNHLNSGSIGRAIHGEWQQWASSQCSCTWDRPSSATREPFPTSRTDTGIDPACQLHAVVTACADYCRLLDDDWRRIADWYRITGGRPTGIHGHDLYTRTYGAPVEGEPGAS